MSPDERAGGEAGRERRQSQVCDLRVLDPLARRLSAIGGDCRRILQAHPAGASCWFCFFV